MTYDQALMIIYNHFSYGRPKIMHAILVVMSNMDASEEDLQQTYSVVYELRSRRQANV